MEIGKTRSGTVIEYKPNQAIEDFLDDLKSLSDGDKFDVFCIYQWLVIRAMPKKPHNPSDYDWWESRLTEMNELTGEELIKREKSETNIRTSYEMVQFGKKMVANFWRES